MQHTVLLRKHVVRIVRMHGETLHARRDAGGPRIVRIIQQEIVYLDFLREWHTCPVNRPRWNEFNSLRARLCC